MYPNLEAEFARKKLTLEKVAPMLGITVSTLSLKRNGRYDFTLNEAKKIKYEVLQTDIPLEILFEEVPEEVS